MNLTQHIKSSLDHVVSKFTKWRKISECDVITDDCGNYLSFYPELLNYVGEEVEIYEVWIACEFYDPELEFCQQLTEHFAKIGMWPMRSNNFIKKFFVVESDHCICYFNPNYDKGVHVKELL